MQMPGNYGPFIAVLIMQLKNKVFLFRSPLSFWIEFCGRKMDSGSKRWNTILVLEIS
jgi:hypothetical protein